MAGVGREHAGKVKFELKELSCKKVSTKMCVELVGHALPHILDGAIDTEQLLVAGGGSSPPSGTKPPMKDTPEHCVCDSSANCQCAMARGSLCVRSQPQSHPGKRPKTN